jgi:putative Mg2+ transporter-C (MgtC) family protein
MPAQSYAHHYIRFDRKNVMSEEQVRTLLKEQGFTIANMSYCITEGGTFEYRMVIRTSYPGNIARLAHALRELTSVREFLISPTGD